MVRYFAYGSNMDKDDLDKWCRAKKVPLVKFLSVFPAKLSGYKLSFNYFSFTREGGAANIMKSKGDCVYGLLIEMTDSDLNTVRKKEGYCENAASRYYDEICLDVEEFDGTIIQGVTTYKVAKHREEPGHQRPTRCYLLLIIRNAEKYGFPADYINFLKSVKTKD